MSPEGTDFLYPFIEADEHDVGALLDDLAASATGQGRGERPAARPHPRSPRRRSRPGRAGAGGPFRAGGRLYTFGNGGSSTDAASVAALFAQVRPARRCPLGVSSPTRPC